MQIGRSIGEIILRNHRAIAKIVWNNTYDVTVAELKKCGRFETVLVSSSPSTSEEDNSKSKVSTFKFIQDSKLKENGLATSQVKQGLQLYPRPSPRTAHWRRNTAMLKKSGCPHTLKKNISDSIEPRVDWVTRLSHEPRRAPSIPVETTSQSVHKNNLWCRRRFRSYLVLGACLPTSA